MIRARLLVKGISIQSRFCPAARSLLSMLEACGKERAQLFPSIFKRAGQSFAYM
jgi:hypothetical protein